MSSITTFFASIMLFVSSLFGNPPKQEETQLPIHVVETSTEQKTAKAGTQKEQSHATSTENDLATYHNNIFGYEIQYPKNWNLTYDKGSIYLNDPSQTDSKKEPSTVLSIIPFDFDAKHNNSIDSWISKNWYILNTNSTSSVQKSSLHGDEVREIAADKCGKNVLILHDAVLFLLQYGDSGFSICESNIGAIKAAVSSFKFVTLKTKQDIASTTYLLTDRRRTGILLDSRTKIINDDPIATIEKDYYGHSIYTTKDKKRVFFYLPLETECEGEGCILNLSYLDIKESRYHNTELSFYPFPKNENRPIAILPNFDVQSKKLLASNLEINKEITIYSNTNNLESLVSSCVALDSKSDDPSADHYSPAYTNDIEELSDNKIRIGVYKEDGQSKKECTQETVRKYEKIRDDYVDLTKF